MLGVRPILLEKLSRLRPKVHVCGHIHEARGTVTHKWRSNNSSGDDHADPEEGKEERTIFINPSTSLRPELNGRERLPIQSGVNSVETNNTRHE